MRFRFTAAILLSFLCSPSYATPVEYTAAFATGGTFMGRSLTNVAITLAGYGDTAGFIVGGNHGGFAVGTLDSLYVSVGGSAFAVLGESGIDYQGQVDILIFGGGGGDIGFDFGVNTAENILQDYSGTGNVILSSPGYTTTFTTTGGPLTLELPDGVPVRFTTTLNPTPEPSGLVLLATGLAGGLETLRRRLGCCR